MDRRALLLFATVASVAMLACEEPAGSGPDAGPDAAPEGQGSEARAELAVNEVAPRTGAGADWLEIVNRSTAAVDLCGYFVTDDLDRLDHYLPLGGVMPPEPCEPRLLDAGAYLVIDADDGAPALDHAPFKLGPADAVHVVTVSGLPVDSLVYLFPEWATGLSLSRSPDGEGLFFVAEPTPGSANHEVAP